jgi:superfamily II DNA/RNA helicase
MNIQKSCPMCRETTELNNIVSVIDTERLRETSLMVSDVPKHIKTREDVFRDIIHDCNRTIVFCNYDESFRVIKKILDSETIKYGVLKGKKESRDKVLNEYIKGEISVLLLNTLYNGNGMEFQNTTDIVMYHDMNEYTKTQVIGRANRIGRTCSLNVHYLKMY